MYHFISYMIFRPLNTAKWTKTPIDQSPRPCCLRWVGRLWYCDVMQIPIVISFWPIVLRTFLNGSRASFRRRQVDYHSLIDQSHRYGRHQAACREPAGSYDKTTRTAICFEHKTQYLLICAPYTCIVVFWHIRNITPPPWFRRVKLVVIPPPSYIAAIFVKYCYTAGSWLL